MQNENNNYLDRAAEYWQRNEPLEAGRLIFEHLPTSVRPKWASRILRLVVEKSDIRFQPIEHILFIADHPGEWKDAKRAFDVLRDSVLKLDRRRNKYGLSNEEELLSCILALSELVAKVVYNATDPTDEFDEDSGWWIVACLKGFVGNEWKDENFAQAAWSALCLDK